jgi:hypothetical protein
MKKRVFVSGIAIILLGLGLAWLFGWFGGSRAMAEVQELQTKLADPALKDGDRRALRDQLRAKMDALSPAARDAIRDANREKFQQRMSDHMAKILAMAGAEQTKALDEDIDRMEKLRAQRDAAAKTNTANRPAARGGYRPDADLVNRVRNRLDRSTPQMRAQRDQYTRLVNQRRQQRGLPPTTRTGR